MNKCMNEYRPEALTSLVIISFEKIIKDVLLNKVQTNLDLLQFAYRSSRGVDEATGTLLNTNLTHLEGAKSFVQLQPHILAELPQNHCNIDAELIC